MNYTRTDEDQNRCSAVCRFTEAVVDLRLSILQVLTVILLIGSCQYGWAQATGQSKSVSEASSSQQNFLLIVSDDLKASALGCYENRICKTPNIDKLARNGMLFERAYCQAMWCAPSRQSFMHSRYQGSVKTNLGSHLIENGYYSARVGKIYHMRVPGDIIAGTNGADIASTWTERFNSSGLEAHTPGDYACLNLNIFTTKLAGRQSTRMPHRPYVTVSYKGDGADQPDYKSADKAIEILRQRAAGNDVADQKPFFLAVGLVRPHYPMVAPKQYFDLYDPARIRPPEIPLNDLDDIPKAGMTPATSKKVGFDKFPQNISKMWAGYYASVTFMDDQVGRIIDELDRLGLRENTTIIFTSDHGYHLGEHHLWQKSNLHEEVTRVPLIIDAPGQPTGSTQALVELMDLFPTIADLAGTAIPKSVQGESLVPVLDGKSTVREASFSIHRGVSVRTAKYSYIRYLNGDEEFYDMDSDPMQFTNLAFIKDAPATVIGELDRHRRIADAKIETFGVRLAQKKKGKTK